MQKLERREKKGTFIKHSQTSRTACSLLHIAVSMTPGAYHTVKGKVSSYSLPSVGPGADPGVQAVSPQVT